jgi:hypothetical protein
MRSPKGGLILPHLKRLGFQVMMNVGHTLGKGVETSSALTSCPMRGYNLLEVRRKRRRKKRSQMLC